jgi:hypothetical protein
MLGEVMLRASLGTTLALLAALGVTAAGSLAANASPADAPADTFTVNLVTTVSPSLPNQLSVIVKSPSTITGLTASMMSGTDDEYDAALTMHSSFPDPTDPTQTITQWQAAIPMGTSPSGLALGNYTVNLTATYSDSTTSSVTDGGNFAYLVRPAVELTAANPRLTYGTTSTALSGTVTLANPDGTPDTDYTGLSVNISDGGQAPLATLPVSGTGTFSDQAFTPPGGGDVIVAQVAATATVAMAESPAVDISEVAVTPTLTLNVNSVTETYGKPVTVTGTLMYVSGSTSIPVTSQQIWISTEQSGDTPLVTGTTGTNGSFTITLPEQAAGGPLYVGSVDTNELLPVAVPLTLKVVHPTVISGLKVSLSQYWALTVSGCLGLPSGDNTERIAHTSGLTVQYAATTRGPWKNLVKINGNERDTTCGTGGIKFTGSATAPGNYAYYRVVYAGTTGATSYAAAASNTVLTWRYADRITGLKVSPTAVNAGGKLTIKGTLQYYYKTWHNYSGQVVWIYLHPQGSNPTWYWLVKVKTNAKGQFSATFRDPVSATWQAVFWGNNNNGVGHLSTGSSEVYVRLK